jgi:hypothetical protein
MGAAYLQEESTAKLLGFGEALQAIFFPRLCGGVAPLGL